MSFNSIVNGRKTTMNDDDEQGPKIDHGYIKTYSYLKTYK